jgi:hypothetical protein
MTHGMNHMRFARKLLLLAFVFVIAINLSVLFFHDPVTDRASASAPSVAFSDEQKLVDVERSETSTKLKR